jgi:hypothetical protein
MAEVLGYRAVIADLKHAEKAIRLGVRKEIRQAAEPVRATAQELAIARVRNMTVGWSRMRVGVTQAGVYVVPRKRGTRTPKHKRPEFSDLMMARVMEPALYYHQAGAVRDIERIVDRECARFNRMP